MTYQECLEQENKTQSESFSPGLVKNEEIVARLIMSPKHYQDGEVDATAFEQVLSGMSVLRKTNPSTFKKDSLSLINYFGKDGTQSYVGYVKASVNDIRAVIQETYRLFYVLDTASEKLISHVDIHAIRSDEVKKALNLPKKPFHQYLRSEIANLFNKHGLIDNSSEFATEDN
jgi:hypothetical protein